MAGEVAAVGTAVKGAAKGLAARAGAGKLASTLGMSNPMLMALILSFFYGEDITNAIYGLLGKDSPEMMHAKEAGRQAKAERTAQMRSSKQFREEQEAERLKYQMMDLQQGQNETMLGLLQGKSGAEMQGMAMAPSAIGGPAAPSLRASHLLGG
jgi:hypothetical protein